MWAPNVTDPGLVALYVYNKGTTVYVYGWAYYYDTEDGEIQVGEGDLFAYEVQFSNTINAQGFASNVMNVLSAWKSAVQNNKLNFNTIFNYLREGDTIETIAERNGGTVTDFTNDGFSGRYFNSMDEMVSLLSDYLEDINNDWDAGFPTNLELYYGKMLLPPETVIKTPYLTGDWLVDEDI
jgi:hypothetical protein